MDAQETTFNDIPNIIGKLVSKVDNIEKLLVSFKKEFEKSGASKDHVTMTLQEAAAFLKVKPSTMYYYVENNKIPCTKKGKIIVFFKDELMKWQEAGRNTARVYTYEEVQAKVMNNIKRRPKRRRNLPD